MRLDSTVIHADDLDEVVGSFYDTDIREVNLDAVELREIGDAQMFARLALGEEFTNVELFPGEAIQGNVIRRVTTSEVLGNEFYAKEIPTGLQVPIDAVPEGALVTWRPNNENFAVVHEEVAE